MSFCNKDMKSSEKVHTLVHTLLRNFYLFSKKSLLIFADPQYKGKYADFSTKPEVL